MERDQALTPGDADQPAAQLAPTLEEEIRAWQLENGQRYQQLQRDARSAFRAMQGWRALEGEDAWRDTWLDGPRGVPLRPLPAGAAWGGAVPRPHIDGDALEPAPGAD